MAKNNRLSFGADLGHTSSKEKPLVWSWSRDCRYVKPQDGVQWHQNWENHVILSVLPDICTLWVHYRHYRPSTYHKIMLVTSIRSKQVSK